MQFNNKIKYKIKNKLLYLIIIHKLKWAVELLSILILLEIKNYSN